MDIKNIRLNERALNVIQKEFKVFFLKDDSLWIFGSRVDIHKKGGDIDLYIETHLEEPSIIMNRKIKFLVAIKKELGDQKIDVIVRQRASDFNLPIYDIAKNEGIKII